MSQHDNIVIATIDHIVREVTKKYYILVHNLTYKSTVT